MNEGRKKHKKKKKTRRDTVEIARSVVEQAIGEKLSGAPLEDKQSPPDRRGPRPTDPNELAKWIVDQSTDDSDKPQTPE